MVWTAMGTVWGAKGNQRVADTSMVELKRIYWSRHALRLAYSATILWLGFSVLLSLMPDPGRTAAGPNTSSPAEVLRGMFDGVLAAAAVPGLCLLVLSILAASSLAGTSGAAIRSGASPASSAAKAWPGPTASARWKRASGAGVPAPLNTATISTRGPRADPPACRTSSPPAPGATGRKAPGSLRPASRSGLNDDGGST